MKVNTGKKGKAFKPMDIVVKKEMPPKLEEEKADKKEGTLKELEDWNWGGFFLTWIWAIGNRVWIGLFGIIPFFTPLVAFYLAIKGNKLAWRKMKNRKMDKFKDKQRIWGRWGFILFGISVAAILISILAANWYIEETNYLDSTPLNQKVSNMY